jgi:hypothetical protein
LLAVGAVVFSGAYPTQFRSASASVPGFQPVAYTLDVLLTGAGWLLTTAVVAGLTNALKRD